MKRCQPWLGTYVEICAEGLDDALLNAAIDDAFAAVEQVHRHMSFHDAESDLSRLNMGAHLDVVKVHPWTYQVLELGLRLHHATGRLFDCAVAPSLIKWGHLPCVADLDERTGSMRDIRLLPEEYVRFDQPLALDLGGIAKGFAVDRAIDALKDAGVACAVVNAGGDLRVFGEQAETVHVRDPRNPGTLITLGQITDGAVATSASYFVGASENSTVQSVLVDPRSSTPILEKASYTVIAKICAVADALTKVLAIDGNTQASYFNAFNAQGAVL